MESVLKTMFVAKWNSGAVVLLASCTIASLTIFSVAPPQVPAAGDGSAGVVPSKGRLFTPDKTLTYVNVYTTGPNADQIDPFRVAHNLKFQLLRIKGIGIARNLGDRISVMRIRIDHDRARAHNLSSEDVIERALAWSGIVQRGDWLEAARWTSFKPKEHERIFFVYGNNMPEQYENIILKVGPEGAMLRLKDVGRVELVSTLFDISSDVDGHPAATVVLKRAPDSDAVEVIDAVKEELKHIKKESFPPAMEFEVIPFDSRDMIYAVIETPRGSKLEYTSAKCHELGVIANGIDGVTSVTALSGYQLRAESGGSSLGTCLIHLTDRSDRKLTSRQIIEQLEEKCRTMNVLLEFFEPPAASAFFAAGGFSVRVLDKTNSNNDERPGRMSEKFMDDLLNREDLAGLFNFLASNYPQYELVIDNDVALQQGVSIANAMENLAKVVASDVPAETKFRALVEELSHSSVKNDRGEMAPYRLFLQLKNKLGLNDTDPLKPVFLYRDSR